MTPEVVEQVVDLLHQGWTKTAIRRHFNVAHTTILDALRNIGYCHRPPSVLRILPSELGNFPAWTTEPGRFTIHRGGRSTETPYGPLLEDAS